MHKKKAEWMLKIFKQLHLNQIYTRISPTYHVIHQFIVIVSCSHCKCKIGIIRKMSGLIDITEFPSSSRYWQIMATRMKLPIRLQERKVDPYLHFSQLNYQYYRLANISNCCVNTHSCQYLSQL